MILEEIKEKYPNEWVLLKNPTIENTKVLPGIFICHAKDKRDIVAQKNYWRANL